MGWISVGSHIYTFDLEEMSAVREIVVQSENSVRPRKVVARKDWNAAVQGLFCSHAFSSVYAATTQANCVFITLFKPAQTLCV